MIPSGRDKGREMGNLTDKNDRRNYTVVYGQVEKSGERLRGGEII